MIVSMSERATTEEIAGVVRRINEGLAAILSRHGLRTLDEAVGCRADELAAGATV